jgi:Domain of unknown function (DUF4263)
MRRKTSKQKIAKKGRAKNYVTVTSPFYGKNLKGTRIYFEGKKPSKLRNDGTIKLGKHILEMLKDKFLKFHWIITSGEDSIRTERNIVRVRTSLKMLQRMSKEEWDRGRDIKNDIVGRFFAIAFPDHFTDRKASTYVPGTLAAILRREVVQRLSSEDKEALTVFIPEFAASEAIGTVSRLRVTTEIRTLTELAEDFEKEIVAERAESWWQTYIEAKILLIQHGYIKALPKLNIALGNTKYPDFSLITHDNYLDILEIKKPHTPLLKLDKDRGNYFWENEIAKAIIQVENYIAHVSNHAADLRSYVLDNFEIDMKAIRPRGIILAGDTRTFDNQKIKDDFRLLREGIKNVTILTYDELLTRLQNYIAVLKEFGGPKVSKKRGL